MTTLTLLRLRHNTRKVLRRHRVWLIDSPYYAAAWWKR